MTTIESTIAAARVALLLDMPFFGALALRLELREGETETMATDGRRLYYSAAWVQTLTRRELMAVIAHEVLHCALSHHARIGGRDPEKWNIAADYAINPIVASAGLPLPAGALLDSKYHGLSAEEIYRRLSQEQAGMPQPCPWGEVRPQAAEQGQDSTDSEDSEAHGKPAQGGPPTPGSGQDDPEWQVAAAQAAQAAHARGKLPSGLARLAESIVRPPPDWRAVLRDFVSAAVHARDDYSWTRPHRRSTARGMYMPSLHSEAIGPIAVIVDTSGSIYGQILTDFAESARSIAEDLGVSIELASADAWVYPLGTIEPGDPMPGDLPGGGGTDFRPAIAWAGALPESPSVIVYLTDGYGAYGDDPGIPVLWVMPNSRFEAAPWGRTVYMTEVQR